MSIFDQNNPPASPDSTLDSDLANAQSIICQDGSSLMVAPGDWVDIDPSVTSPDINWGYSYQVCSIQPNAEPALQTVNILLSQDGGQTYSPIQLSASWIQECYRRVMKDV